MKTTFITSADKDIIKNIETIGKNLKKRKEELEREMIRLNKEAERKQSKLFKELNTSYKHLIGKDVVITYKEDDAIHKTVVEFGGFATHGWNGWDCIGPVFYTTQSGGIYRCAVANIEHLQDIAMQDGIISMELYAPKYKKAK
jgi:hypothetical protein